MKFCENECNRVNNMDRFIFINILRGRNRLKNKFITKIKDKKNFNNLLYNCMFKKNIKNIIPLRTI